MDECVLRTLPHLGVIVQDMVLVQWHTGMRPGEVCRLQWSEIDDGRTPWVYRPAQHKTKYLGQRREVLIGPQARRLLVKYEEQEPIFTMKRTSYTRAIARGCERAGVLRWSPNQLRHSRGTHAREVAGLDTAGALLGHTKLETTQVYAALSGEKSREYAERYG